MNSPTPNLFDIIAWVETKSDGTLFRFEPAIYTKLSLARTDSQKQIIAAIQKANPGMSWNTALVVYSTSYGATQIMGFNLYGPQLRYQDTVADFMGVPLGGDSMPSDRICVDQIVYSNRLFAAMSIDFTPAALAVSPALRHKFAVTWNGAPEYADLIVDSLKDHHFIVTE